MQTAETPAANVYGPAQTRAYRRCGEFLADLLHVVLTHPAYLRASDVPHYASLIGQFRRHVVHGGTSKPQAAVVADLPVDDLLTALWQWVWAAVNDDSAAPVMSTFVLDAAHFIIAHAWGQEFGMCGQWKLEPMMRGPRDHRTTLPDEPRLKKAITEQLRDQLVLLGIPEGSCIIESSTTRVIAPAGEAHFLIKRCHLSASQHGDQIDAEIQENNPPKHDIASNFMLTGTFLTMRARQERERAIEEKQKILRGDLTLEEAMIEQGPTTLAGRRLGFQLLVPGRWICAWEDRLEHKWIPLPNWTP